ncbi:MAG: ribosomal protein S18-alanine N-acetyltransferase [Clostridia bacterium]|nr:ribosomal protein S18-alanine N-acetyltransferase [Clostridia bacterium]
MYIDTQNIIFTKMNKSHIARVAEIEQVCFADEAWSYSMLFGELGDESKRYTVALDGDVVVAYGGYAHIIDEAHIMNIAVEPAYRKKGIGRRVLEYLIMDARARNISAMTLEVKSGNGAAVALYEKNGFVLAGIRKKYYKNTHDALIYWKQL